jgi:di/tricarboxylate transporter
MCYVAYRSQTVLKSGNTLLIIARPEESMPGIGAGRYTFKDYARMGISLTILLVIILLIVVPFLMSIG